MLVMATVDGSNVPSMSESFDRTVTVTGVDDALTDNDKNYFINLAPAVSTDLNYSGLDPNDVTVTNVDDDTAGIVVTPTAGLVTTEAGSADTFSVVLSNQPTADVTIGISSSDTTEGTVSVSGQYYY